MLTDCSECLLKSAPRGWWVNPPVGSNPSDALLSSLQHWTGLSADEVVSSLRDHYQDPLDRPKLCVGPHTVQIRWFLNLELTKKREEAELARVRELHRVRKLSKLRKQGKPVDAALLAKPALPHVCLCGLTPCGGESIWSHALSATRKARRWLRLTAQFTGGNPTQWSHRVWDSFSCRVFAQYLIGRGEKFFKFITVNVASVLLSQQLIEGPFPWVGKGYLFLGGGGFCWLNALFRVRDHRRRLEHAFCVLNSKGLLAEAHDAVVNQSVHSTMDDLTRCPYEMLNQMRLDWRRRHHCFSLEVDGVPWPSYLDVPPFQPAKHVQAALDPPPASVLKQLEKEVVRTVNEVFSDPAVRCHSSARRIKLPSTSGHTTSTRKSGGAFGRLDGRGRLDNWCHECESVALATLPCTADLPGFGVVQIGTHAPIDPSSLEHRCRHILCIDLSPGGWSDSEWIGGKRGCPAYYGPLDVKLVGLREPLKVRVISLGDPELYTGLAQWQQAFWRIRYHPAFRLTGSPIDHEVEFVGNRLGPLLEGEVYTSIDYVGATNNLHPFLVDVCANAACAANAMDPDDTAWLYASLAKSRLLYRSRKAFMSWGQLMGHPLSFVLLNLINAAIVRFAFEQGENIRRGTSGFRVRLRDLPALFNGDDAVVRWPKATEEIWRPLTTIAGLAPSPGKNWTSTEFFTINSEMFVPRPDGLTPEERRTCPSVLLPNGERAGVSDWELLSYARLSCIDPGSASRRGAERKRAGKRPGRAAETDELCWAPSNLLTLADNWNELVHRSPPHLLEDLTAEFMKQNREELSRCPPGMSWWADRRVGGLGMKPTFDLGAASERVSDLQALAHWIIGFSAEQADFRLPTVLSDPSSLGLPQPFLDSEQEYHLLPDDWLHCPDDGSVELPEAPSALDADLLTYWSIGVDDASPTDAPDLDSWYEFWRDALRRARDALSSQDPSSLPSPDQARMHTLYPVCAGRRLLRFCRPVDAEYQVIFSYTPLSTPLD